MRHDDPHFPAYLAIAKAVTAQAKLGSISFQRDADGAWTWRADAPLGALEADVKAFAAKLPNI